ncbi:ABC transporter ATP-binding protein [Clostridium cylindrosporum]|uniref:ABC-type quaternary amine transporter n=1 Tax=Clostridium cylindrosporum DSM 605 TaxID=1121307 RepID=A0A0J8DFH2_CLOCY|nr:ABC transporter ATP-binding protein [Clostridium cylindrosporum]KMT22928.1 ABC-type proline/glycine betaine transport system, ATPase component [Clostridium cylindrosporum DSM 605]
MIRLENITKTYEDTLAVNDVSLKINKGEISVLLGSSGCGKSTIIRMINRLITPSKGNIYIDNKNINDYDIVALRRSIGYVVQSVGLFPHMTVYENIAVTPKLLKWSKSKINNRVNELLELVGLEPETFKKKKPRELSGGEAQRVGVARALAGDPPILLMDEPFGAVDPLNRKRLQIEFLKIQQSLKKTVIFVTHDVEEAIILGNKIAVLSDGKVQNYDDPVNLIMKNKNEFVEDFLGSEYSLKLLLKYKVSDVLKSKVEYSSKNIVIKEMSIQELLAVMVKDGKSKIEINDIQSKYKYTVEIQDILSFLRLNITENNCNRLDGTANELKAKVMG